MHLLYEFAGVALIIVAAGMLWVAKPVDGKPALFLRKRNLYEVSYALAVLFVAASGFAGLILGFTT